MAIVSFELISKFFCKQNTVLICLYFSRPINHFLFSFVLILVLKITFGRSAGANLEQIRVQCLCLFCFQSPLDRR